MEAIGFGPTLGLRQRRSGAAFDFTAGALPPGASLARGSAATRVNAAGVLVSEASQVARFDYDPATLALRGLLIEAAASNLLGRSEQLQLASLANMSVTADAASAPDGAMTMDRLTPNAGTAAPYASLLYSKTSGTTYCFSGFIKGGAGIQWGVLCADSFGSGRLAWFDLNAGTVAQAGANTIAATIRDFGGGIYRCAIIFTGSNSVHHMFSASTVAGSYNGSTFSGSDSVFGWGAMLEEGARATSYIATPGTSAVARAADVLTLDWASRGVGDGAIGARATFDDLTTQDLAMTVTGGSASLSGGALTRPCVRRIERV
jgi:hypothetical protein